MYRVLFVELNRHSGEKTPYELDWKDLGFALDACARGSADAMSLLAEQPYSLIVIDMFGAHDEGMELCGKLRSKSGIPIILIGGSNDFQLARKAMSYQVSDYLPNPLSADDLRTSLLTVKRALVSVPSANYKMPALSVSERDSSSVANVIDKVKEYVEEALHQNITLKQISHILHFNCSYLGQKFKIHENMTFLEYLLQQRMEKAKHLLEHTDMKIYEIAGEVGYTEMDWFYKKFKSYTGVSANEYRKRISITA
ncbi:helix-turn-helix domain-containing protein [Paenibacillus sp. N4]|uniref:helix-turn-helix domain-containing protein n=1 Tax=Paenibacillus vietnamensis TaxID=2590547 RepID=UPI001CD0BF0F|nr:helix-turn-helix domain-containing protein [Paenibacillus vietnamensis]MCA0753491.1 helix-turn-helix domain-containing protein [Paenibacillus vietnamensis]